METMLYTGLLILAILWAFYGVATVRSPDPESFERCGLRVPIVVKRPIGEVRDSLRRFGPSSGYTLERSDNDRMIFGEGPSWTGFHWGFFYVVKLTEETPEATSLQVGQVSRLFQVGPVPLARMERFVDRLSAVLT